jgi:hypothetical protein
MTKRNKQYDLLGTGVVYEEQGDYSIWLVIWLLTKTEDDTMFSLSVRQGIIIAINEERLQAEIDMISRDSYEEYDTVEAEYVLLTDLLDNMDSDIRAAMILHEFDENVDKGEKGK